MYKSGHRISSFQSKIRGIMQISLLFYRKKFVVLWVLMGIFILGLLSKKEAWAEDWVLDTTPLIEAADRKIDEGQKMKEQAISMIVKYFEAGWTEEQLVAELGEEMREPIQEAKRRFENAK